ncbi:chemotaxis protein CheW [Massilia sp. LXY-6]|uniref:chemotaxis protein CheW n=1 Tax=Massilia sp. LXY-6 TaxID=3379823 RepID=UPI003EE14803
MTGFAWEEVLRRLEASAASLAALGTEDPAAQERLLRERAAVLAGTAVPTAARPDDGIEVLAFQCGGERYAFEAAWVARVLPLLPLTAVPGLPDFYAGITMAEGEVLAVLDLRVLLALPLSELADPAALIVLRGEDQRFAVLAEAVDGACRFARDGLGHCLPMLADLDKSYLLGVAPDRTALLDARRLLTDSTLVVNVDR